MNIPKKAAKIPEKKKQLTFKKMFSAVQYIEHKFNLFKRLQRTQGHVHTHNGKSSP